MDMEVAYCTDTGTNKKINQDSACVMIADTVFGPVCMAILCDGMGGISCGEYASQSVVTEFTKWFEEELPQKINMEVDLSQIREEWFAMLIRLDVQMREYGKTKNIKLGTTATCMLFLKNEYLLAQLGDSRAYEIRRYTHQLTEDQSLVQDKVNRGEITLQEAKDHPRKNVLLHCVGGSRPSIPVCSQGKIQKNACYLLCSDGFIHEICEEEIVKYLSPYKVMGIDEIQENLEHMVDMIKFRGEKDNITAVVIKVPRQRENHISLWLNGKKNNRAKSPFYLTKKVLLTKDNPLKKNEIPTTDTEED